MRATSKASTEIVFLRNFKISVSYSYRKIQILKSSKERSGNFFSYIKVNYTRTYMDIHFRSGRMCTRSLSIYFFLNFKSECKKSAWSRYDTEYLKLDICYIDCVVYTMCRLPV